MTTFSITVTDGTSNIVSSITVGDITATLDASYDVQTTADGEQYIVAASGARISAFSPPKEVVASRLMNGEQRTPQRSSLNFQALDSGPTGAINGYDASKAADLTAVIPVNDCLVKVKSKSTLGTYAGREGLWTQIAGFHVVSARKPSGAFAAPYVWPLADLANRPWRVADVDGLLSSITMFTSVASEIPWATLRPWFDHLDLGRGITGSTAGGGYEWVTVHPSSDTVLYNYDRNGLQLQAAVLVGLMGQTWSTADKTQAMIRLLQHGCQWGEPYVAFQQGGADGAHYNTQYAPSMAWLKATGRESQIVPWVLYTGGNAVWQSYRVTAGMFDPHDDPLKPYCARRRTVLAISGSGPYEVTVTGYFPASGVTQDTAGNGVLAGLNLVREASGTTAYISTSAATASDWVLTLNALPAGLIVGDTIYCASVTPLPVGTADWIVRKVNEYPNLANPSPSAAYRDLYRPGIAHLFVTNIRMSHADALTARDYCVRAMAGGSGLPPVCSAVAAEVTGSVNNCATEFWTANSAAILALPQDV